MANIYRVTLGSAILVTMNPADFGRPSAPTPETVRMRILCCLLAVLCLPLSAAQVEMVDGRVLDGVIDIEGSTAQHLLLTVSSGRMQVGMRLPRDEIVSIDHAKSARQLTLEGIDQAAEALGTAGTAADWWALAEASAEHDPIRHKELARIALSRDRNHAEARKALGFQQFNGIWMLPHERAIAEGKMFIDGRWQTWDSLMAAEEQRLAEEEARGDRLAALEERREARREARRQVHAARTASLGWQTGSSGGLDRLYPRFWRRGHHHHGLPACYQDDRYILSPATRRAGAIGTFGP